MYIEWCLAHRDLVLVILCEGSGGRNDVAFRKSHWLD